MNLNLIIAKGLKHSLNPPVLRNCILDKTSEACPKSKLNIVKMGHYSYVENDCFMVNVDIGACCMVADRVCIAGQAIQ